MGMRRSNERAYSIPCGCMSHWRISVGLAPLLTIWDIIPLVERGSTIYLRSLLLGSYEVDKFLLRMDLQFLVHMTNVHLRGVSRYAQVVFYCGDIPAE